MWQDNNDKNGIINPRLEIRYMGGFDYPNKIDDINNNILKIMECVDIAMDNDLHFNNINKIKNHNKEANNIKYLKLLSDNDVDRNWNDLNEVERNLCKKIFKIDNLLDLEIEFNKTKDVIKIIKQGYENGIKI